MNGVTLNEQAQVNGAVQTSFFNGQAHVYYGIIGIFSIGAILVAGIFAKYNWILGILLMIIATGIFVDLWPMLSHINDMLHL